MHIANQQVELCECNFERIAHESAWGEPLADTYGGVCAALSKALRRPHLQTYSSTTQRRLPRTGGATLALPLALVKALAFGPALAFPWQGFWRQPWRGVFGVVFAGALPFGEALCPDFTLLLPFEAAATFAGFSI